MERHHYWNVSTIALGFFLIALLLLSEVAAGRSAERRQANDRAWEPYLAEMDSALQRHDISTASRAWQDARGMALQHRGWNGLIDTADGYRRLAAEAALPDHGGAAARELYRTALFRARAAGSLAGAVRATEGFESLGDALVVGRGLLVARALATRDADADARARLRALSARAEATTSPDIPGF
jgi:hypothetical protein